VEKYHSFAPIYSVRKHFEASGYADAIDAVLGPRSEKCLFDYPDIVFALAAVMFTGGATAEDLDKRVKHELELLPGLRVPGTDTLLNTMRQLTVAPTIVEHKHAEQVGGKKEWVTKQYTFCMHDALNRLLIQVLLQRGQIKHGGHYDFDYDHQIIECYNLRGGLPEKTFDMMNNDFAWNHLPFSDIAQNNVFLLLTALMRNFYAYLVALCAALKDSPIQLGTRMKNFIFHFMTMVGQWARHARQNVLSVYTDAPAWFAPLLL